MSTERYKGIYRVDSARLPNWDYGSDGSYFITGCTYKRQKFFGEIVDKKMILNEAGRILDELLIKVTERYPHILLDKKQVMPNHFHAIYILNNKLKKKEIITDFSELIPQDEFTFSGHTPKKFLQHTDDKIAGGITGINNPMLHQNISTAMRALAAEGTLTIRKIMPTFKWQGRFYDNVIRDHESYLNIWNYIDDNPKNWKEDRFYEP